jgi:hypothetical protein
MHSMLSKKSDYHQLLNISKVFNCESSIHQSIEHHMLTDL